MKEIDKLERLRNYLSPIVTHFHILKDIEESSIDIQKPHFHKIREDNIKVCYEMIPKIISLLNNGNTSGDQD